MVGQSKASIRKKIRSAFAHKKLADTLVDQLYATQNAWNLVLAKLDADAPGTLDTDYEATQALASTWDSEAVLSGQSRVSARKLMQSALAHRKLADEICDAMTEMQTAYTALLVKLDAEAGTLAATDYASSLSLTVLDASSSALPAQHKASIRRSLRSALASTAAADYVLSGISELQDSINAALALLDAGTITGVMAALQVTATSPDAE